MKKRAFKRWFIQGLAIILPVVMTFIILYYAIVYTDAALWTLWEHLPWETYKPTFPGLGLMIVILVTTLIGALAESFIINKVISAFHTTMTRLPLIKNIYSIILQIVQGVLGKNSYSKAVIIEYPKEGIFTVAFKTSQAPASLSSKIGDETMINIFVPTTPNPTSGFYLMVPESKVIETDIDPEDAVKLIMSAGMVTDK